MRRILVLRGGGLGDFIVTLPALALLRQAWPRARIELTGNPAFAVLGVREGLLDAVHAQSEARWSRLYADGPLPPSLAEWLDGVDLIVDYWPDPEGDLARRLPSRPGQWHLQGAAGKPEGGPAALHFAAALRELGLEPRDAFHRLRTFETERNRRRIAVHPGSGSPSKNWPLGRWRDLCRHLRETEGAEILVLAGEAEAAGILGEFGAGLRGRPVEEAAAALAACGRFIGHDSGISHLAAACGTPSVLLFGPTDPAVWAPPAAHVRVLRKGARLAEIEVQDVLGAINSLPPV